MYHSDVDVHKYQHRHLHDHYDRIATVGVWNETSSFLEISKEVLLSVGMIIRRLLDDIQLFSIINPHDGTVVNE